jgi:murein DD-endopeptidase MepM/ murein hydrolase activator NlpD
VRKNIRITNPVSGPGFTSLNRAKRFVKHGDAEWAQVGVSIRFVRSPCNSRELSVLQNARIAPYWYERASHEGIARIDALANTPVIAPAKLLGLGKRKGASRHTFLSTRGF